MSDNVLSVFVDESGDFGAYEKHSPFYIVALVFHEQRIDISKNISSFDRHILDLGYPPHVVHVGPLIRREDFYINDSRDLRRSLFNTLYHFARQLEFEFLCATLRKDECRDSLEHTTKLSREIADLLYSREDYLRSFDRIIVYYDNGQMELTKILSSVFNTIFSNVTFRKAKPSDYKLAQVADLICSLQLFRQKAAKGILSPSEIDFFGSEREFNKNIWKSIEKKYL